MLPPLTIPDTKREPRPILMTALLIIFITIPGLIQTSRAETSTAAVRPHVAVEPSGAVVVEYEVSGIPPGRDVTLTTSLAGADRSTAVRARYLNEGAFRYRCEFDGAGLRAGNYVLITRLSVQGPESAAVDQVFHLMPVRYRTDQVAGYRPIIMVQTDPVMVPKLDFMATRMVMIPGTQRNLVPNTADSPRSPEIRRASSR